MTNNKYRTRPVEIEAEQFHGEDGKLPFSLQGVITYSIDKGGWGLMTGAGWVRVRRGDWIVKDARGAFFPVDSDLFHEQYELVPDEDDDEDQEQPPAKGKGGK